MKVFNYRYVIFYCFSIVSVLLLFHFITDHGERHLRAAPRVGGKYTVLSEKLPPCFRTSPLTLNLEQSGVYLAADLSDKTRTVSLTGKIRDRGIRLDSPSPGCALTLTVARDGMRLAGELKDNDSALVIPVALEKQTATIAPPPSH